MEKRGVLRGNSGEPKYKFLEHMTDAEIEAYGTTLEEAFENAALALEDTMTDIRKISPSEKFTVALRASDQAQLLYSWLEWLIVQEETKGMLFSKFRCRILSSDKKDSEFNAEAWGEKYDPSKHEQKTAVKAPTFHEMKIEDEKVATGRRVKLHFLLDL
jgi:SHS2 domain-containing protein